MAGTKGEDLTSDVDIEGPSGELEFIEFMQDIISDYAGEYGHLSKWR